MAKTKDASTAIISGSREHATVKKKAVDGRQETVVGGRKRKIFNANRYKSLFIPQRIRIESDDKEVPEGQDNSPQDNASTNGDVDKELKVQNSIRVQEAHDEAQQASLDEMMDADQVEFGGRCSQTKTQDGNSTENGNVEKQIGGECSPSNWNADYDACGDNDNHIIHTSSSRQYIENQQELDPCDKVTGTCKAAGVTENAVNNDAATNVQNYGNISNSSKFIEFWVPVQLSNVQLEQYCATLLSNATVLCCGSKDTVGGALHDIFISNRKCCNHPYVVDPTLHSKILKDQEPTMLKLDADIKASGKLQFLDLILPEVKKRQLRVLIFFQSTTVTTKGVPSVGEMLFDFVHQRFGEDSYECVLTGLQPSTRQTALNKFNKDMSIPFFLLEHRACHASIKLSSVDIIVIFDSDLTPANDLKSLQKISVDSLSEQIMIFRLYSSSTLEEKILKLAETNESRLHNVRSRYDALLKWGASDLFDRLAEFHRGSVVSISSEESLLKDVVEEFLYLIFNKSESNDKSKSIITRVQNFGNYRKNSETKTHLSDGDQPHIFWKKLLEGRLPIWKFVSFSTPRQRKRPHYLDGTTNGTSTEDDGGVKIRRKTVKPVIEGETGNVNEGGSGVPTPNEPQSSSSDRFQYTAVSNDKSLHDLLKATMSELSNVLKLSDDVKITVEKFLEFVLENYRLSSEHTSTLQALMISMCWIGSALQNIKIDRLESFDIAKKHLNFICQLEEAYSVYGKLQPAKEAFVQTERSAASKECIPSPQRAKLDTEKSQHTKSYREEINKFYREWEEQRVNLEKNYRMEQARIRSMHSNLSVRSEKMTRLKETFVSKLEKHVKVREVYLKELKARQLTAKDGHALHRPRDNSPEVGPSHDEPVDRINATEGDGLYDAELTGSHTSEKQMTDAVVSSGPIGEVLTQHHDDIENDVAREVDLPAVEHRNEAGSTDVVPHVESPKTGVPAGNCNQEKATDGNIIPDTSNGGEDCRDSCGSSSNPPSADVSPEVIIPETDSQSPQVQDKQGPAGPNSLVEIDVEYRPFSDASQLGQIILEASSLDPHDEPSLIAENQSDMLLQTEILLEPICEQIPEAPTPPVTAEIQNPNTSSLELNMIDNVNHLSPPTPNHANPLQAEEERLRVVMDGVVKLHEETKARLKSDCEKEIAKMAAQISLKYEAKCQEEEAAFHSKKKEIDANVKRAVMNKILAAAFRSKCQDLTLSSNAGKQQGSQTGLMQQLNRLSGSSHVRRSFNTASISSCQSSGSQQTTSPQLSTLLSTSPPPPTPLALQSQPPLQIVHQPADLFSSQPPPNTNLDTIPLTISTTSRPPPVINPITPSSIANSLSAANQRVNSETLGQASRIQPPVTNGEVRAPAPHMRSLPRSDICAPAPHLRPRAPAPHIRPFRPTSTITPEFANQVRKLPAQHVTSTPLTSPSNSQSPVLPPLRTSSTQPLPLPPPSSGSWPQPLPPLPPQPNVVPPQPPSSESSPQPLPQLVPPRPPSSESSPQPLPPLPTKPCVVRPPPPPPPPPSGSSLQTLPPLPSEPNVVPPPPLSSESSPQPLPPLPTKPCVVRPPPPLSGSSLQPLPPLPSEPYVEPPPPPAPPGSSPQLLPPLPIEPYILPPPPPSSPPPSSIPATSSPLPIASSDTTSPNVLSTPTSGKPSLTLTDNLNALLKDNAARLGNILSTTPDLSTHSTGPEFICLLDDD